MIFTMVGDFRTSLNEGLGKRIYQGLLQTLSFYCQGHFGVEEQLMDEYCCPVAQKNRDAHVKFLEVLSGFEQRYAVSGFDHITR